MTVVSTNNIHELSAAGGGLRVGNATTEKLGFYGLATPIVQPSVTGIGTTVISQVGTTGKWAFSTSTAALAFVSKVQSLQDKLSDLNLIGQT